MYSITTYVTFYNLSPGDTFSRDDLLMVKVSNTSYTNQLGDMVYITEERSRGWVVEQGMDEFGFSGWK